MHHGEGIWNHENRDDRVHGTCQLKGCRTFVFVFVFFVIVLELIVLIASSFTTQVFFSFF